MKQNQISLTHFKLSVKHLRSELFLKQGRLRYRIIGDYPAPSFFNIKEDDGQITVSNDLKTDNLKSTEYSVSIYCICFGNSFNLFEFNPRDVLIIVFKGLSSR